MKNCPLSKNGCVHYKDDTGKVMVGGCVANSQLQRVILNTDKQCPCPDLMQEPEKSFSERVIDRFNNEIHVHLNTTGMIKLKYIINEELEKEKANA